MTWEDILKQRVTSLEDYGYRTRDSWMDATFYVQEQINERYRGNDFAIRQANNAMQRVVSPYLQFMGSWENENSLQDANKKWADLTHKIMLQVHTALNNRFPTLRDAYKSRELNGFFEWKGERYQNMMKEKLLDLDAP